MPEILCADLYHKQISIPPEAGIHHTARFGKFSYLCMLRSVRSETSAPLRRKSPERPFARRSGLGRR